MGVIPGKHAVLALVLVGAVACAPQEDVSAVDKVTMSAQAVDADFPARGVQTDVKCGYEFSGTGEFRAECTCPGEEQSWIVASVTLNPEPAGGYACDFSDRTRAVVICQSKTSSAYSGEVVGDCASASYEKTLEVLD